MVTLLLGNEHIYIYTTHHYTVEMSHLLATLYSITHVTSFVTVKSFSIAYLHGKKTILTDGKTTILTDGKTTILTDGKTIYTHRW